MQVFVGARVISSARQMRAVDTYPSRSTITCHIFRRRSSRIRRNTTTGTRKQRELASASQTEAPSSQADIVYKTSSTDVAFIAMCRKAYGSIAGWQSDRDWKNGDETYKGMVEVSRALMQASKNGIIVNPHEYPTPAAHINHLVSIVCQISCLPYLIASR